MKAFLKKISYVLAVGALLTVSASNVFASLEPKDKWYRDGLILQPDEVEYFDQIETGDGEP